MVVVEDIESGDTITISGERASDDDKEVTVIKSESHIRLKKPEDDPMVSGSVYQNALLVEHDNGSIEIIGIDRVDEDSVNP